MLYTNYCGCRRLFQTTIKNYKVPHFKSTDLNRIQAGPSLGFRSRGGQKPQGGHIFQTNFGCMQQQGSKHEMGGGHHWPLAGDDPASNNCDYAHLPQTYRLNSATALCWLLPPVIVLQQT